MRIKFKQIIINPVGIWLKIKASLIFSLVTPLKVLLQNIHDYTHTHTEKNKNI